MGHAIYYLDFEESVSKEKIVAEADEMAEYESDSRSGLPGTIRWLNHICDDREQAHEFIDKNDDGWYDQLAVRYRKYPPCTPTKALLKLKERLEKEREKANSYAKAHSIASFKIEFIGCPHCGSKLKRTLLRGNSCPLCGTELRSKTTMETLKRYKENIENLEKQIYEEGCRINKRNIKNSKLMWLVKIEYHV